MVVRDLYDTLTLKAGSAAVKVSDESNSDAWDMCTAPGSISVSAEDEHHSSFAAPRLSHGGRGGVETANEARPGDRAPRSPGRAGPGVAVDEDAGGGLRRASEPVPLLGEPGATSVPLPQDI